MTAAVCLLCAAEASGQARGVLAGRIVADSTDTPVARAAILLPELGLSATSDSTGRFRLGGIAPGTHRVLVRRLGFQPVMAQLAFAAPDSIDVDFVLTPIVTELEEVEVTTTLLARKLAAFSERRRFGIGHFMDQAEIEKAPGTRMSEKVRHLPGLIVVYPRRPGETTAIRSTRGSGSIKSPSPGCAVGIYLDGAHVPGYAINDVQPGEIAGLEWYAGPSQIPSQYSGTRAYCAVLLIWTK